MTEPIPLAQFIQARSKLEPSADGGCLQTGGGPVTNGALAQDLAADPPEALPEQEFEDPDSDEAVAERRQELEQAYTRGRSEALAEFQGWWDDHASALHEITSKAQEEIEAGILSSAINLVHTVSARHIREAAISQMIRQVREHLQQCADAVPLVTGPSELGQLVAERFEGTGIQVVSNFDDGDEEVMIKVGNTSFETMIGKWTQEIESTLP